MALQLLVPQPALSARRAEAAYGRLLALSDDHAHRAELLNGGVAAHRVEALYPVDFGAYVPVICASLGEPLAQVTLDVKLLSDQLAAQFSLLPEALRDELREASAAFFTSQEFLELGAAFANLLKTRAKAEVSTQLAVAAAYTFWMMNRRSCLADDKERQNVHELFYQLYTYLLPGLAG